MTVEDVMQFVADCEGLELAGDTPVRVERGLREGGYTTFTISATQRTSVLPAIVEVIE